MSSNLQIQVELLGVLVRVYDTVRHLLEVYDRRRDPNDLDYLIYQVSKLYRLAKLINTSSDETLENIGTSLSILEELQQDSMLLDRDSDRSTVRGNGRYEAMLVLDNRVGRPRLDVPKEQLEYLLSMGFTGPQISIAIGVSLSTVRRRMAQYGLTIGSLYSDVTDQELNSIVSQIKVIFPNSGFRMMQGHLFNQGHRVSQARIRESLRRIDPDGVAIRWSTAIERRTYRVQSPFSLWHLDGNHKLIR